MTLVILGPRPRPGMEGGHEARPRLTIGEGSVVRQAGHLARVGREHQPVLSPGEACPPPSSSSAQPELVCG